MDILGRETTPLRLPVQLLEGLCSRLDVFCITDNAELVSTVVDFHTEALLQLSESNPKQTAATIDELKTTLGQISQLLEQLGNGNPAQKQMLGGQPETSGLTDSFIASVKKSARLGMKLS